MQLRQLVAESGLSARRFAKEVLLRNERTLRRWLSGDAPIPVEVLNYVKGQRKDGEP